MQFDNQRWALPDLQSALLRCNKRNTQGIGCTIDVLGESVKNNKEAKRSIEAYLISTQALNEHNLDAAIAVKLSSIGAGFDKALGRKNLLNIFQNIESQRLNIELDMEGTPSVEYTLNTALECASKGFPVTLALQAYLDRTEHDLKKAFDNDITVRLVKGAYLGDTNDFVEIQERFKNLTELLIKNDRHFTIGTHDPELIEWVRAFAGEQKDLIEFGFLMGLGDETKLDLAKEGWVVSEYIPFGVDTKAYVTRRERYLRELERLGRAPVP